MMTWESNQQPYYIWDGDIWIRGKDAKIFIARIELDAWLGKDGEKIKFEDYIQIGKCA